MNIESDEEDLMCFLTQNSFSQGTFPDFDIFSDILGIEEETPAKEETLPSIERSETREARSRDIHLVTDEEIELQKDERIPKNTKLSTSWAVNTWASWAKERNSIVEAEGKKEKLVNSDILKHEGQNLNYWLSKFVVEIRKAGESGKFYPPNTVYQLVCGLQRHIRNNGQASLNVFEDPQFKHFQDVLDSQMKHLTRLGLGASVKEAQAFTEYEEEKLWSLNLLGDCSPSVLLNTMVFLLGKNFGLRSGQEHRNLQFSQLVLEAATDKEPEKLIYTSFGEKNNQGGLKHRQVKPKRVEHYANESQPERCLINLFKKYKAKCPEAAVMKDTFYLAPRRKYAINDKEWFTANRIGRNTLADTVKKICKEAGIEGHHTNHSLRATTATRGLSKGIPDKFVMQRTGHRDIRSLQKYQRPDVAMKVQISRAYDSTTAVEESENEMKSLKRPLEDKDVLDDGEEKKLSTPSDDGHGAVKRRGGSSFHNCTFVISKDFNIK